MEEESSGIKQEWEADSQSPEDTPGIGPKEGWWKRFLRRLNDFPWPTYLVLFGILVNLIGLAIAIFMLAQNRAEFKQEIEGVQKSITARNFKITNPKNGGIVGRTCAVQGTTPFSDLNIYLVVTSLKIGTLFVQDAPMTSGIGGTMSGMATFGSASAGKGEEFLVQALATKKTLPSGALTTLPGDAILSEPITVTRKQSEEQP